VHLSWEASRPGLLLWSDWSGEVAIIANRVHKVNSSILTTLSDLFMSSGTLWWKYVIFCRLKFIIWGLKEVEHDLKTCQSSWSTCILTLWASLKPENWKWTIKKITYFCHYIPWTKIPDHMNKSTIYNLIIYNLIIYNIIVYNLILYKTTLFSKTLFFTTSLSTYSLIVYHPMV
jgi:hypothetical protein